MKTTFLIFTFIGFGLSTASTLAAPYSITSIRQLQGNTYIAIEKNDVCATNTFVIEEKGPGARQMLAVAIAAFAMGQKVQIEVDPTKCLKDPKSGGWGSPVLGISIAR